MAASTPPPVPGIPAELERRALKPGEVLFWEGDAGDCAYICESGLLEVVRRVGSAEVVLATVGPDELVGEMALIDAVPRSATVRALKGSVVAVVPFDAFMRSLEEADPTVRRLLARFVTMIRKLTDRNVRLTLGLR